MRRQTICGLAKCGALRKIDPGVRGDSGDSILPLYERLIELRSNFQLRAIQIRALVHAAIDRG